MLIPARTDTRYFHEFILNRSEIRFIRGRLKFGDGKNSAPFPSMLVIYRGPNIIQNPYWNMIKESGATRPISFGPRK